MLRRRIRQTRLAGPITIRTSREGDGPALARLAALDDRAVPEGELVVAESGGRLVAALPLDGRSEAIADPFLPTAEVRELLTLRAHQLAWQGESLPLAA
jgi:hypothetical protein